MEEKIFLARIKRNKTTGAIEKGLEVRNGLDDAKQAYHAYLAAYAYGHDSNTDYVQCALFNSDNFMLLGETWILPEPEEEQENEQEVMNET